MTKGNQESLCKGQGVMACWDGSGSTGNRNRVNSTAVLVRDTEPFQLAEGRLCQGGWQRGWGKWVHRHIGAGSPRTFNVGTRITESFMPQNSVT